MEKIHKRTLVQADLGIKAKWAQEFRFFSLPNPSGGVDNVGSPFSKEMGELIEKNLLQSRIPVGIVYSLWGGWSSFVKTLIYIHPCIYMCTCTYTNMRPKHCCII